LEQLKEIENLGPKYRPFAAEVSHLAQQFLIDDIQVLIAELG